MINGLKDSINIVAVYLENRCKWRKYITVSDGTLPCTTDYLEHGHGIGSYLIKAKSKNVSSIVIENLSLFKGNNTYDYFLK